MVQRLYELASSDTARLEAVKQAVVLAKSPAMQRGYPADRALWLVAQAHNAALSAKGRRDVAVAQQFLRRALDLKAATGCPALSVQSCQKLLAEWSGDEAPMDAEG